MELEDNFDPPGTCFSVRAFLHLRNDCRPDEVRIVAVSISRYQHRCRPNGLTSS